MPYIPNTERVLLEDSIDAVYNKIYSFNESDVRNNDGRLNYCITEILCNCLELDSDPRYTKLNTALGVLEGVKLELYDRIGRPYEDLAVDKSEDIGVYKRFTAWYIDKRKELGL